MVHDLYLSLPKLNLMKISNNILETIGNTPMVKLNKITSDVDALVLAKVEFFNPGSSVKDRMAVKMVEDAEADGRLKPGGTIFFNIFFLLNNNHLMFIIQM